MRLARLKLIGMAPFWILNPIKLHPGNRISPLLDIDKLTPTQKDIIDKSILAREVILLSGDASQEVIPGTTDQIIMFDGNTVDTEDIPEEQDTIPEIISVTTISPEDLEEQAVEEDGWVIEKKFYDEADILLDKHHSTIIKYIKALPQEDDNLTLLHACEEVEREGKKRSSVLNAIETAISEY
jgi:hypothetical protein